MKEICRATGSLKEVSDCILKISTVTKYVKIYEYVETLHYVEKWKLKLSKASGKEHLHEEEILHSYFNTFIDKASSTLYVVSYVYSRNPVTDEENAEVVVGEAKNETEVLRAFDEFGETLLKHLEDIIEEHGEKEDEELLRKVERALRRERKNLSTVITERVKERKLSKQST